MTEKKEETPYCAQIPSFSSCLDQVCHILFPNILLKKEESADQRKTFISDMISKLTLLHLYFSYRKLKPSYIISSYYMYINVNN